MAENAIRPTKKQRELLSYIEAFISEHGYSPSYREIMNGLNYTSVATVSLHVNSLIRRGHLRKRDRSARSLEVVADSGEKSIAAPKPKAGNEQWLVETVENFFTELEAAAQIPQTALDELYVLVGSLKVLGLDTAAQSFIARLPALDKKAV